MERTVPHTASEEIELYLRTVYSLLRSSTEVQIRTLEEVHAGMNSLLHAHARALTPDISAFIYSQLRLPTEITAVRSVVLGQSLTVFYQHGYADVENWEQVYARGRRRKCYFDGVGTLACFIASRTDIDDVIPTLTAFQIEWNKLHLLLAPVPDEILDKAAGDQSAFKKLAEDIDIEPDDLGRLQVIWGDQFKEYLHKIKRKHVSLGVRLLSGSLSEYWRATREWWENIERACPDILSHPVYFTSSNTHSITNLLTGYAADQEDELLQYIQRSENPELLKIWEDLHHNPTSNGIGNILYYVLKKYQQSPGGAGKFEAQIQAEQRAGVLRVFPEHSFDIEAQVIDLKKLDFNRFDPRLQDKELEFLRKSDAYLLNIDYPLGLTAYNILAKVAEHVSPMLGVYVMGKSASLNGVIGDVIIPNVVQDEHSQNTYLFQNVFTAQDVSPFLDYGTVLDNQKAVSVLGTFLQTSKFMDIFYREGFSDIEMEGGPYLSAVYEMYRPQRHPYNEIVNLYGIPFDLGILHYVSDTPLGKGRNLGAGTLSYYGMDATYATSIAILKRVFHQERLRLGKA